MGKREAFVPQSVLTAAAVDDYCRSFIGYEDLTAPIWLVGLEEGTKHDPAEELAFRIQFRRLRNIAAGPMNLYDLNGFLTEHGLVQPRFFEPPFTLQPTWRALLRVCLRVNGQTGVILPKDLRPVQATKLGVPGACCALLELLPLPNKSRADWGYASLAGPLSMPVLRSRSDFERAYLPTRIEVIQGLIDRFTPRCVLFYGFGEFGTWEGIAGSRPLPIPSVDAFRTYRGSTQIVVTKQPVAFGVTNDYWDRVADAIRKV